ncbi:hypothetical protein GCM10023191_017010 [Actinoallomurus oryzae]|uniref:Uncharacterized protein n=1 Tax=Actinoallomurus oryzae TaxID=502180 RepID=A0ABP8PKK5_9ACTN
MTASATHTVANTTARAARYVGRVGMTPQLSAYTLCARGRLTQIRHSRAYALDARGRPRRKTGGVPMSANLNVAGY